MDEKKIIIKLDFIQKTVTTAGTRVQISGIMKPIKYILVIANEDNTGKIYFGGNDVSSTRCVALTAGKTFYFGMDDDSNKWLDLFDFWVDASANTQGVCIVYATY